MQVCVCTYRYFYTLSTTGWVWNPKVCLNQDPKLHLAASRSRISGSKHGTEVDQFFKEMWQLAAEDTAALSCWAMDRAHPGIVHIHLLFHNTYRSIPTEMKLVPLKEMNNLHRKYICLKKSQANSFHIQDLNLSRAWNSDVSLLFILEDSPKATLFGEQQISWMCQQKSHKFNNWAQKNRLTVKKQTSPLNFLRIILKYYFKTSLAFYFFPNVSTPYYPFNS